MLRKFFIGFLCLTLVWTSVAIDSAQAGWFGFGDPANATSAAAPATVDSGRYPVQQATYDDATGEYALVLLDTPPGKSPVFRSADLQMARTTDDEPIAGSYLSLADGQPVLHLTEDFRIEYVHAVTETQENPQTGQPETVIVRRESNFWTPFAGAIAGQAIGNALFGPRYYVPPIYTSSPMVGYGGAGSTYGQAVSAYKDKHNSPPPAVKNRTKLNTSGNLRRTRSGFGSNRTRANATRRTNQNRMKSSGSGFGGSNLRSNGSRPRMQRRSSGFGSGGRSRSRSFGRRRR